MKKKNHDEKFHQLMDEHAFYIHEVYESGLITRSLMSLFEMNAHNYSMLCTPYTTILGDSIVWEKQEGWFINGKFIWC